MRKLSLLLLVLSMSGQVFGHGTNRVPDSSFECGLARGWNPYMTGNDAYQGNQCWQYELLTNIAWHGRYSFCMLPESRLITRSILLTNGPWCLSYYVRTPSGSGGGTFKAGVVSGAQLGTLAVPAQNGTVPGTWTRYSTNITITSNTFYWVQFYTLSIATLIDGIQLEPGTSPTTYEPLSTVELGIGTGGTYNMFFSGDASPSFPLKFWNTGTATTARVYCDVYDTWNSNLVSSSAVNAYLAAGTNTSTNFTLPSRKGWLRVFTRLLDYDNSDDESKFVVYPYSSNAVMQATNWLGGHPHGRPFHVHRERLAGRSMGRTHSPNFRNTRWNSFEPSRGNFAFFLEDITNAPLGGMALVGTITSSDELGWPTWATNADGTADLMALSNAWYRCVQTNKQYIKIWEAGPNEPHQTGPTTPINVREATNYALVLSYGVAGITNADPTAQIIGIAGADGGGEWGWEVWTNLTPNIQSWIDIVSTHQYLRDKSPPYDPNEPYYYGLTESFNNPAPWITKFRGVRPVWNTEAGAFGLGYHHGLNGMWPVVFDPKKNWVAAGWVDEAIRYEVDNLQLVLTGHNLAVALICIGSGFEAFFYYDCRYFNESSFSTISTQPYIADYQQVDRPVGVALSVAQHKVRGGIGPITNASATGIQMFLYTNAVGQAVVAAWNADRTNRTLVVSNNNFSASDMMGNEGATNASTIRITRLPQYFTSGTLSLTQLSNTFAFATPAGVADTVAPRLTFDVAPSGLWNGATNAALIKWTGIDDTWVSWASNTVTSKSATNVAFKWKLNGSAYNSYNQSNHVWLANIPAGTNTFWVTAMDRNLNAEEYSYDFTPPFSAPEGGGGATNTINVQTLNIGTITLIAP